MPVCMCVCVSVSLSVRVKQVALCAHIAFALSVSLALVHSNCACSWLSHARSHLLSLVVSLSALAGCSLSVWVQSACLHWSADCRRLIEWAKFNSFHAPMGEVPHTHTHSRSLSLFLSLSFSLYCSLALSLSFLRSRSLSFPAALAKSRASWLKLYYRNQCREFLCGRFKRFVRAEREPEPERLAYFVFCFFIFVFYLAFYRIGFSSPRMTLLEFFGDRVCAWAWVWLQIGNCLPK